MEFESTNSKSKLVLTTLIVLLLALFSFFVPFSAGFSGTYFIEPGEFSKEQIDLPYDGENVLRVKSNNSIDILILNETEYGRYLAGLSYTLEMKLEDIRTKELKCDKDFVIHVLGFDYETMEQNDEPVYFFIIMENSGPGEAEVSVRINYDSEFLNTLRHATNFAKIGFTIYLSIYLFIQAKQAKKEEEMERFNMSRGFGFTFLIATVAYISDSLNSWIPLEFNVDFYPKIKYNGIFLSFISFRFDQMIFLTLILISDFFMIYEIEKIVADRERPILSYMLILSIGLNVLTFFVPLMIDIALLAYVIILLVTVAQIISIYGKVIRQSRGTIRYKSIAIISGFIIPLVMGFIGGELIPENSDLSYIISNSINIVSIFLIKFGLD